MRRSESIDNILPAITKVQLGIERVTKSARNDYFKSNYADLNAVMDACKKLYNDNGITVIQAVDHDEHGEFVETTLMHESGQYIASRMKLRATKEDMQAYGSAVTYARRYTLQTITFLGAEDDDANEASGKQATKSEAKPAKAGGFRGASKPKEEDKKVEAKVPTEEVPKDQPKVEEPKEDTVVPPPTSSTKRAGSFRR